MSNTEAPVAGSPSDDITALEVRGVQKHFGSFAALQHVDLSSLDFIVLVLLVPDSI
jgi:ABC-type branched-subunit amino acid transport system ATPase component